MSELLIIGLFVGAIVGLPWVRARLGMSEQSKPTAADPLVAFAIRVFLAVWTAMVSIFAGIVMIGAAHMIVRQVALTLGLPDGARYVRTGAGEKVVMAVAVCESLLVTLVGALFMPRLRTRFEPLVYFPSITTVGIGSMITIWCFWAKV